MRPRAIVAGVAFVALVAGTTGKPAAQAPPAGDQPDALVAEVRAPHAELNQKESTLSQAMASAQGRWYEFNTRLEIEREIASRTR
jgi:hypothetical protein